MRPSPRHAAKPEQAVKPEPAVAPAPVPEPEPEPEPVQAQAAKRRTLRRSPTPRGRRALLKNKWIAGALGFLVPLVIIAIVALVLRTFIVSPYYIPSESMEPTLHGCATCDDDRVLVDKFTYRLTDPKRGDVVVFHRPTTWTGVDEKVIIKRVVAVAGDVLTERNGRLYLNGKAVNEPYINDKCPPLGQGANPWQKAKVGPIPKGQLFVMGDNRCESSDSRFNGTVPVKDVIGRAFMIIWPLGRIHWL